MSESILPSVHHGPNLLHTFDTVFRLCAGRFEVGFQTKHSNIRPPSFTQLKTLKGYSPLQELTALSQTLAGFKGVASRRRKEDWK